jgi:hypothetical protein
MHDVEKQEPVFRRLARAFSFQYNVILFFGAFLYAAAVASWLPALIGVCCEAIWLMVGVTAGGCRWIEKRRARASMPAIGALDASSVADLPGYAARIEALARVCDGVRRVKLDTTGVTSAEHGATIVHLDETQRSFVRLASLHQRLSQFLAHMPAAELESEVQRRSQALSGEKDLAVRMALRQSLGLVQRRLQHRELTANMLRAVELRMTAIEQSFLYIESHVLELGSALELKAEVDALVARVSSVDALEAGAGDAIASVGGNSHPVPVVLDLD